MTLRCKIAKLKERGNLKKSPGLKKYTAEIRCEIKAPNERRAKESISESNIQAK